MKKLCAFILAITATVSVFACQPYVRTEKNHVTTIVSTITQAAKTSDSDVEIITYIGNKNTKKFHLPSCYTLPKEKNRVYISSYERAISRGFKPCKNCHLYIDK